jgi:hypothetical protein
MENHSPLHRYGFCPMLLLCRMRFAITALIWCVTCVLGTGYANALTSRELLLSCEAVDQTAEAGDGNSVDISSAGLPCWYYMSGVQNMSTLADEANERLLNICSPSDSTVLDFARVFVHYVHGTNIRVENPAALVFKALIKAYPCAERP